MSDLQQVVVGFEPFRVGAENMFQVQAAILLTIESLVLNMPAMSSPFRGNLLHRAGVNLKVRDPGEHGGFAVDHFRAFDRAKVLGSALVILKGQAVNPVIDLVHTLGCRACQFIPGAELQ